MAIYNFGMRGKEHLEHLLGDNSLPYKKTQAFKRIIDWVTDNGLDIVEVYNELRVLLDVNRDKESTKPKLFKAVIIKEWHPHVAQIVIAKDEEEARQLCYISSNNYDVWLSEDDCIVTEISLSTSGVVQLGMLGNPLG